MAPLPLDSTARVKIRYHTCGEDHTAQIRFIDPADADAVVADFNALISACGAMFYQSDYISAQLAISGSNVFNDIAGDWPVSWGSGVGPHYASALYNDFVGRSADGRRVRFALFGAQSLQTGDDYRALASEDARVAAAVAVLNGTDGTFVSINGFAAVWKPYTNQGTNAYWRNHIR